MDEEVTARADEWSEVWSELEWIALGPAHDHRDEAEKRPEDQADARRLLDLLIDRTPDGVEDLDNDEAYGVRLGQRDVNRIVELTGVHVGS